MCNSWNHSPGCTCGFGGEGHLGGYKNTHDIFALSQLRIDKSNYGSYINPNAICPVCGASVYFYQSPEGGRVFFDDLGPPWPKHPCTDNGQVPKLNKAIVKVTPPWTKYGWTPLVNFALTLIEGQYLITCNLLNDHQKELIENYVMKEDMDFKNSDFKFYKNIDNHRFEIIYLIIKKNKIGKIIGYKRDSAIKLGFGRNIPIEVGEELTCEFKGIDLGLRIQVNLIDRFTTLKCFVDKRHISEDTAKKLRIVPYIKFTFLARVISKTKEITLIEID